MKNGLIFKFDDKIWVDAHIEYNNWQSRSPKRKEEGRSPLIVEFGNPVDQIIRSRYYTFWPGDISRKAQETQNLPSAHLSNFYWWLALKTTYL